MEIAVMQFPETAGQRPADNGLADLRTAGVRATDPGPRQRIVTSSRTASASIRTLA